MSRLTRDGTADPSSETKFSGANADREIFMFPVQLTTSTIGNLRPTLMGTKSLYENRPNPFFFFFFFNLMGTRMVEVRIAKTV